MPPPNKKPKSSTGDEPTRWRPTLSDVNSKKENDRHLASWSNLPAVFIRHIYENLADVDRASMARVCKTWHEGFHDPCLWSKKNILFYHRKDEQDVKANIEFCYTSGRNAIKLVKQFPRYLKKMTLSFLTDHWRWPKEIINDFEKFSKLLDDADLEEINFLGLKLDTLKWQMRQKLTKALKRLIEKQESLKIFFMENAYFDLECGLKFLKSLATSSGATIEILSLKGFCQEEILIYHERRCVTELQKFTNLFYIHIDYVMLSGELMQFWCKACPSLSFIDISSNGLLPENHEIRCEAWQDLTTSHPKLSVTLNAKKFISVRQILPVLSPAIPISKLKLEAWNYGSTSEIELKRFLHHLTSYRRTIKKLFLEIPGVFQGFDTISVQNILSDCRHLLPFTCEESIHLFTGRNVWRLRHINQSLAEDI